MIVVESSLLAQPPLVWKSLVGEQLTVEDLRDIDYFCCQCIDGIRKAEANGVTRDNFNDIFFETFTTTLTDGSERDLLGDGNGASTVVTFDNRLRYATLVESARLHESDAQLAAVRDGLIEMVGDVLWLFTWADLELAICGSPQVDVDQVCCCVDLFPK